VTEPEPHDSGSAPEERAALSSERQLPGDLVLSAEAAAEIYGEERVRAIAAKQERMRRTGELDDDADTLTAIGYTADVDVRAEAEADRHADMARGVSSGGTFRIPHEDQ